MIVLVGRRRARVLGHVRASTRCDLGLVDDLLRLLLASRRIDRRLVLERVDPALAALLRLVGVASLFGQDGQLPEVCSSTDPSTRRGGSPKSAKRSG